jgi:hypothetical protein
MGFAVRYIALPWLEKKLLVAVTTTLGEVLETKAEIIAVARLFDGHLIWSQNEVDRIWHELERRKANENASARDINDRYGSDG